MPASLRDKYAKIKYDFVEVKEVKPKFETNGTLPKVSILPYKSEDGHNAIYISAPEGKLNVVVRSYLKTRNFKKFITFKNIEVD